MSQAVIFFRGGHRLKHAAGEATPFRPLACLPPGPESWVATGWLDLPRRLEQGEPLRVEDHGEGLSYMATVGEIVVRQYPGRPPTWRCRFTSVGLPTMI